MKTRNNKRFVAFFVAISMIVGILCGNGNVIVTQAEDEKSDIEKLHEKDGYKEAGPYTNADLPAEAEYYSLEAKSDDIYLILDAVNTNYKYMEFKGSEIDEVAGYLNDMYVYFNTLMEKENGEIVKYFGEKTLIYEPDSKATGKGTLKFSNEDDEKFEREITVKFEDTNVETGGNIKVTLSENANVIKGIEITKENICTITENNGSKYKLSVEDYKPENDKYTIKYSSIDDKEWISLKKSGKTYSLEVTKAMNDKYGISLWYKDIGPTEEPTAEPPTTTVAPTNTPTKQHDTKVSPSPEIQIKPSVTIEMGNPIKYKRLVTGKIKGKKIQVKIPKKYKKLLTASDKDKKITAKYTKKKLPENEIKVKVTVGAYTQDVMVKVIVAEPKNVKIKTELIKVNGKKYNKIKFFYKFNKKTSVKVKLKGKNKQFNTILNKYVKGNKGYKYNKNVYVTTPSRKKTVTFKILLRCGKNKSDWIEKKLKLK